MRYNMMLAAVLLTIPLQAKELDKSIIGCVDGDALYLLDKYRSIGSEKAIGMLLNGGLCSSINPDSCLDAEVAFLLERALSQSNTTYADKIMLGGLCERLPAGEEFSVVEGGLFVDVIKITSSGKTYYTNLSN